MSEAADRKLFLGGRLKRLRRRLDLTQTAMAADLGVTPSYLNHVERNQRPVSAQLLLRLAETYDVDLRDLGGQTGAAGEAELSEVFADPLFRDLPVPRHEILNLAEDLPGAADAVIRLYRAFSGEEGQGEAAPRPARDPRAAAVDWVRDHIEARRNHFPELDLLGEALYAELTVEPGAAATQGLEALMRARLAARHHTGVRVMPVEVMMDWPHRFDPHQRRMLLSETLPASSRAFALARHLAVVEHGAEIEALVRQSSAPDAACRELLTATLIGTLAAAILMPYAPFQRLAEDAGYDIDRLMARFQVSFEQAAHRLTTLSRPTARGVPFHFVRVEASGQVSKRFASSSFPVARFGGVGPAWRLQAAFQTPARLVIQVIDTGDGQQWFTLARTVTASGSASPDRIVGLGCDLRHADRLIYARGLDLASPDLARLGPFARLG